MFDLKLDEKYSKKLKSLINFLNNNQSSLNQFSLVHPYHLLEEWSKEYKYDGMNIVMLTKNYDSNHDSPFVFYGCDNSYQLHPCDMTTYNPNVSRKIRINPEHLAVSDAPYNIHDKSVSNTYKFKIEKHSNNKYIQMDWSNSIAPSVSDTVICFIDSVRILYSAINNDIKNLREIDKQKQVKQAN